MTKSFAHAFAGASWALRTQLNLRIQLALALVALAACRYFQVAAAETAAVLIASGLVLALELANTAIEAVCDEVTLERRESIRLIKDASAAAVLVASLSAAAVGVVIFGPHLVRLF